MVVICSFSLLLCMGTHVSGGFHGLVVMSNAMFSSDDDMSLAGLTQENPEYRSKSLTQSSDEHDGISNLHALFELARKLAGGEGKDFGDAVFDLSQVEKRPLM